MTKCFFENLETITIEQLLNAKRSVKIAVAWINFSDYKSIFNKMIENKVKIKIIINDDDNKRYVNEIEEYGGQNKTC